MEGEPPCQQLERDDSESRGERPSYICEGKLLATGRRAARPPDHEHPRPRADEISRYPDIKALSVWLSGNNRRRQFWAGELKGPMPELPGLQRLRGEPCSLLQQERSSLGRRTGRSAPEQDHHRPLRPPLYEAVRQLLLTFEQCPDRDRHLVGHLGDIPHSLGGRLAGQDLRDNGKQD